LNTTRVSQEANGGVVDARQYPDFCIQGVTGGKIYMVMIRGFSPIDSLDPGKAGGAGSEDCLKVNIYTPSGAKKGSNRTLFFDIS
jgi:hypothetical protein